MQDVDLKGAWSGPAALQLFDHVMADVARLPVLEVLSATHFIGDMTLGLGEVVFDYLAPGVSAEAHPPRAIEEAADERDAADPRRRDESRTSRRSRGGYDRVALVLQGGGALGAYQIGVFQALTEAGVEPNWISGVSIGAINSAIIAGNGPERRLKNLEAFWNTISGRKIWSFTPQGDHFPRPAQSDELALHADDGPAGILPAAAAPTPGCNGRAPMARPAIMIRRVEDRRSKASSISTF